MILKEVTEAASQEFIKGLIFSEMYPGLSHQILDIRVSQKPIEYQKASQEIERFGKDILQKMGG